MIKTLSPDNFIKTPLNGEMSPLIDANPSYLIYSAAGNVIIKDLRNKQPDRQI